MLGLENPGDKLGTSVFIIPGEIVTQGRPFDNAG